MKLTLVEPFTSRPAPENQVQSEEMDGFQPIIIKKIDPEIGSESNSEADQKSKYRRYLEFLDYLSKHRSFKRNTMSSQEPYKKRAMVCYDRIKDYQSSLDLLGNRLDILA